MLGIVPQLSHDVIDKGRPILGGHVVRQQFRRSLAVGEIISSSQCSDSVSDTHKREEDGSSQGAAFEVAYRRGRGYLFMVKNDIQITTPDRCSDRRLIRCLGRRTVGVVRGVGWWGW